MTERISTEIAIIGGGVIGLAIAIRLRSDGRSITIIEPGSHRSSAAYGSAGTIADYAVIPVGTPAVLRNLPSLLFDRDSPLSIRVAALPMLMPWLIRFAYQSLPHNCRRNAAALAPMLTDALPAWRELASAVQCEDLLRENGCLYLYDSKAAFASASSEIALRKCHDVAQNLLTADEVAGLEPELPPFEGGGVFFPNAAHLTDPGILMQRLVQAAKATGVEFVKARAERIERMGQDVCVSSPSFNLTAKTVVIAAGAHSKALAAQVGDRVLLDTERGYHIEFDMHTPLLSRPISPTSRGFYLIPMAQRLRVAGTVELGGLSAPANPNRLALLECGANAIFARLGKPNRTWLGFRPSMPDSLPIIRPSHGGRNVILAFGHGHLGLTLAPVTARMISQIIGNNASDIRAD